MLPFEERDIPFLPERMGGSHKGAFRPMNDDYVKSRQKSATVVVKNVRLHTGTTRSVKQLTPKAAAKSYSEDLPLRIRKCCRGVARDSQTGAVITVKTENRCVTAINSK